ncbi:MAG: PAS domain S-box protein [Melioribacteraceae bacterium]|nr:PAS domain S-box protein [Melioribacteraceae bacterium]MCF8395823.1 PAS domain S-box protein [Melioribacteraceae bacterium]MCF8420917.1 PAS domain S-box protein [Melioribacteraceae bacterium]
MSPQERLFSNSADIKSSIRIAVIYFLISVIWILSSDAILNSFADNQDTLTVLQSYKGIFFVVLSTILIYLLVFQDRQKLKHVQEELVEANERLKLATHAAKMGVWELNIETSELIWDNQLYSLYEISPENFTNNFEAWEKTLHPDDKERLMSEYQKNIATGSDVDTQFKIVTPSGKIKIMESKGVVLKEGDKPNKIIGVNRDITESNENEKILAESEKKYRELFDANPLPMWIYDAETLEFLDVNDAAINKYGFSKEEFLNMTIAEIRPDEDKIKLKESVAYRKTITEYSKGWRHVLRNGSIIDVEITSHIVEYENKSAILVMAQDVTEKKKIEERMKLNQFGIDNSQIGIYQIDEDGKILYANKHACESLGFSSRELYDMSVLDIDPTFELDTWLEHRKVAKEAGSRVIETVHRRKDGTEFPVEVYINYLEYDNKLISFSFVKDISERKEAEEELRLTKFGVDNSQVAVYQVNTDGDILYVNQKACEMIGYTEHQFRGKKIFEINKTFDKKKWAVHVENMKLQKSEIFETIHTKKDGSEIHVEVSANYFEFKNKSIIFSFVRDLTERKRAEKEREDSNQRNNALVEALGEIVYEHDLINDKIMWEGNTEAILGFTIEELGKDVKGWIEHVYPDDLDSVMRELSLARSEIRNYDLEYRILCKDGKYKWFHDDGVPIKNDEGKLVRLIGVMKDISRRKLWEEELRQSEEKLRSFFESNLIGTINGSIYGDVYLANDEYLRIIGYTREELERNEINWEKITPSRWLQADAMGIEEAKKFGVCTPYEKEYVRKDGTIVSVLVGYVLIGEKKEESMAFILDLTEMKEKENELRKTQALLKNLNRHLQDAREHERESVAREIHDEIGQVLSSVKLNISMIIRDLKNSGEQDLVKILEELASINKVIDASVEGTRILIRKLRPDILDKLGLLPALEWQIKETQKIFKGEIRFLHNFEEEIKFSPQKDIVIFRFLQEGLTNILRHSHADRVVIKFTIISDNLTLSISDNGKGFDTGKGKLDKSFGLLGMKERLESIGGRLNIESKIGRGTKLVAKFSLKD